MEQERDRIPEQVPDHPDLLEMGLAFWNEWRLQNPETRPMLSNVVLRDKSLVKAAFHGADLRGADFCGSSLFRADFRGADLVGANLEDVDLFSADLRGANLIGASSLMTTTRPSTSATIHLFEEVGARQVRLVLQQSEQARHTADGAGCHRENAKRAGAPECWRSRVEADVAGDGDALVKGHELIGAHIKE